ncbi:MFS transporter [Thermoplasma sp. Kam2015]|nr:MFS transporter [Thermoplasma sp. Kam2015]
MKVDPNDKEKNGLSWEDFKRKVFFPIDSQKSKAFNYKMLLLTGGGIFLDGYNIIIIGFGLAGISAVFHPSKYLLGLISVSVIIGNLVGALISGPVVDKIGRKLIFILDLILFVLFAIISGFVANATELLIARFLVGLGIGLDYPIATSYLSEFTPIKPRGKYLVMNITFFNIAGIFAAIVAYALLPLGTDVAWRYMLMSAAVPAIITILGRLRTPDSPRWLLIHGKKNEAIESIEKVTETKMDLETKKMIQETTFEPEKSGYYKELLTKYTRNALFLGFFYFFFAIAFVNSAIYGPALLKSFGVQGEIESISYWSLFVIGDIICILLIDISGRRKMTLAGWAGMLITMALLIFLPNTLKFGLLISFLFFAMFQGIGPGSLHMVYSPELFPTRIRATAEGWKQGLGRTAGVLTGVVFPSLPLTYELYLLLIACLAGLLLSIAFAPETKGKSLEEISEMHMASEKTS